MDDAQRYALRKAFSTADTASDSIETEKLGEKTIVQAADKVDNILTGILDGLK